MQIRSTCKLVMPLLLLTTAILIVGCAPTQSTSQHPNGLICQSTSTTSNGVPGDKTGTDCRFKCPDGRLLSLPGAVISESKDELNLLFCGVPLPTPTSVAGAAATAAAALTPEVTSVPVLSQTVESCNLITHTIAFTFNSPKADLSGQTLIVDIQGQPTECSSPIGMPGTLACKLPLGVSFPTGIVIKLNGQISELFPFAGNGCYNGPAPRLVKTALPPTEASTAAATQPPTPRATQPLPTQPLPTQPPPTQQPTQPPAPTQAPPPTDVPPPTEAPPPTEPPAPTEGVLGGLPWLIGTLLP